MSLDITAAVGETMETPIGLLDIKKFLGRGKSGYSYLAGKADESFVLKLMHYEEVSCYSFDDANKVDLEGRAYHDLKALGIPVPRLILSEPERNYLLKEYIDGAVATELIIGESLSAPVLEQLFDMADRAEKQGINLDYFPDNFVLKGDRLFYIDYEINPYKKDWNLENWGIWYWVNGRGMERFRETGDPSHINRDTESGIPHKEGFRDQVEVWRSVYGK